MIASTQWPVRMNTRVNSTRSARDQRSPSQDALACAGSPAGAHALISTRRKGRVQSIPGKPGYHKQIAATCARFRNCRYDNGALYRMVIQRADLTPDANHLSVRGQRKMAATAWAVLY
jgi:hypothetical protein